MKKIILFIFFNLFAVVILAQEGKTYYVTSNRLNLRSEPTTKSEILTKLEKYDNLIYLEESSVSGWARVSYNDLEGFVSLEYIKRGKAVVNTYSVRIGAKCKDGTNSSATGKGACSHHGGVAYWITKENKTVDIIED